MFKNLLVKFRVTRAIKIWSKTHPSDEPISVFAKREGDVLLTMILFKNANGDVLDHLILEKHKDGRTNLRK